MKSQTIIALGLLLASASPSISAERPYIRSKEAAIKIGEAFLVSIFGEQILEQRPFVANDDKTSWMLVGTLHCPKDKVCVGGVAQIRFSKDDARILSVGHTK